nr:hypothetical protein [uncultured Actinoplanes sp.]
MSTRKHAAFLALAAASALSLAACTHGGGTPAPRNAPPVTTTEAAPATAEATAATSAPVNTTGMKYTALAATCPTIDGRAGTPQQSSADTGTSTAACTYGEKAGLPPVKSSATIAKGGNPKGKPEQVTKELYKSVVADVNAKKVDGVATKPRPGLGDEAVLVTSFDDNTTVLVVRQGNALIQTSVTIAPMDDRESELTALQAQEPVVTEVAKSMLAQLR